MRKRYNNEKLNGTPRTIETRVFFVDMKRGTTTAIAHIPVILGGQHSSDRSYTPFGALEREVYYDFPDDSNEAHQCGEYLAAFDEHHNKTQEEYHYDVTDDQLYTFENEYDDEGRLIRQTEWNKRKYAEQKIVAEFDCRGLISRRTTYNYLNQNDSYELTNTMVFVYDDDGRLVQMTVTDNKGQLKSEEKRVYDGDGTLLRKNIRHYDHDQTIRFTYRKDIRYFIVIRKSYNWKSIHYRSSPMDEHGNVVADHMYDLVSRVEDGRPEKDCRCEDFFYEYVYDEQGNWTRQNFHIRKKHYFVTRKIEYYE